MPAKPEEPSPQFKSEIALAAIKGEKTLAQLSEEYGVSPAQIKRWKQELLQRSPEIFQRKGKSTNPNALTAPLHQEIDRLTMELNWLKEKVRSHNPDNS